VGHKLRTPLALLEGFLEFLLEDEKLSEAEREALRPKIRSNALQLQTRLRDILEYTKIEDGRGSGQAKCTPSDIPLIVTKICGELGLESVRTIYPEADDDLSRAYLPLAPQALELILAEFLKNAQKFHPNQAPTLEVEIFKAATPIGSTKQSDSLCIRVEDDGVTLSAEQLAKIWTPYYQAERGFSGQIPGMGLGLAIVASLIWSVGGTCRATNRLDRTGLVVEVELPLFEAHEAG
jgi:signal transduction histidine kinase